MTIISDDKKFIFVHIPKTGGTSISSVLKEYSEPHNIKKWYVRSSSNHLTSEKIVAQLENPSTYCKFAVVRNPFDLCVSIWAYKIMSGWPQNVGFKEFMLFAHNHQKHPQLKAIRPLFDGGQTSWTHIKGKQVVDVILKFENLKEDFKKVTERLGLVDVCLPKLNQTSHRHFSSYYDKETIQLVQQTFCHDWDTFGYSSNQQHHFSLSDQPWYM